MVKICNDIIFCLRTDYEVIDMTTISLVTERTPRRDFNIFDVIVRTLLPPGEPTELLSLGIPSTSQTARLLPRKSFRSAFVNRSSGKIGASQWVLGARVTVRFYPLTSGIYTRFK